VDKLSLAELSAQAEVAPRTVRFYIAKGLLPGPLRAGREAIYGKVHLQLLERIKGLQAKGMTLAEVSFALSPVATRRELGEPVVWLEYQLAHDIVVQVRSGIAPWRHKAIRNVLAETAAKLQDESEKRKTE
jgi:DNA-binding transcriptional MerR regulator